jgi:hypothetical protein
MKPKRFLALPAFVLVLGLSACGSGSSDATSVSTDVPVEVATETASAETAATQTAPAADTTPSADTTSAANAGAAPAASPELRDCLKANGLEIPEGEFGASGGTPPSLPAGIDPGVIQKALAACQDKLPAGMGLPGAGGLGGAAGPDISAFATCLKDNGVAVPDNPKITDIPLNDPKFAEASKTCAPLAPGRAGALTPGAAEGASS